MNRGRWCEVERHVGADQRIGQPVRADTDLTNLAVLMLVRNGVREHRQLPEQQGQQRNRGDAAGFGTRYQAHGVNNTDLILVVIPDELAKTLIRGFAKLGIETFDLCVAHPAIG